MKVGDIFRWNSGWEKRGTEYVVTRIIWSRRKPGEPVKVFFKEMGKEDAEEQMEFWVRLDLYEKHETITWV